MADNPRYVHVKMNGPTPPNTYKLSMREKRFHGVEAIRMTPIGDQTMHGRDGMLAHSYLLRGGREESHGCVAFEDYPRFLKAFKQGKVTHMVVVPSMSRIAGASGVERPGRVGTEPPLLTHIFVQDGIDQRLVGHPLFCRARLEPCKIALGNRDRDAPALAIERFLGGLLPERALGFDSLGRNPAVLVALAHVALFGLRDA